MRGFCVDLDMVCWNLKQSEEGLRGHGRVFFKLFFEEIMKIENNGCSRAEPS